MAIFIVLVVLITWASVIAARRQKRPSRNPTVPEADQSSPSGPQPPATNKHHTPRVYSYVRDHAENVKATLQMLIGVVAVCVVGWKFLYQFPHKEHAISLLIDGVGVGLAAAAVLELAYTLFTPGPDEALDPLMLGLSATILIQIAGLQRFPTLAQSGSLILLGVLLAILFATRLMLAERDEGDDRPNIWWIPVRSTREGDQNP